MHPHQDSLFDEYQQISLQIRSKLNAGFWKFVDKRNKPGLMNFVHYTNFKGFSNILKNQTLWFSSITDMNDTQELNRGKELIQQFSNQNSQFGRALGAIEKNNPLLWEEMKADYERRLYEDEEKTFVSCWSELNIYSNEHDKLSMWRGYGNDGEGIAISMNLLLTINREDLKGQVALVPVFYEREEEFIDRATECLNTFVVEFGNLEEAIKIEHKSTILHAFSDLCFLLAITHKNIGFKEEQEWRLIWVKDRSPLFLNENVNQHSNLKERFHLPLSYKVDEKDYLAPLINVMIGPCERKIHAQIVAQKLLEKIGYANSEFLVQSSSIPYRKRV